MAELAAITANEDGHLLRNWLLFGRLLRHLGIDVDSRQLSTVVTALQHIGIDRRADVKDAARSILVHHREHLALFDRAFDLFWRAALADPPHQVDLGRLIRRATRKEAQVLTAARADDSVERQASEETVVEPQQTYSAREVLRLKDFAELSGDELWAVRRLLREDLLRIEPRRTRRRQPTRRGRELDLRRSVRHSLRFAGEMIDLTWLERRRRPRPLVVLCDVSGSMEPYSRLLLQFVYSLRTSGSRLEAFAFGTRLTRISRPLRHRDPDRALREATAAVVDWGGGTRIGESLRRFNHDWGRRVLGQGAIVLVISDGWDRGEPERLEREMTRLARTCERLIWLNPLLGSHGYEPLTRGIQIVLRHVDDFLPVHNLASLEQLRQILAGLG